MKKPADIRTTLCRALAVLAGAAFLVVFTSTPLTAQAAGGAGSLAGSASEAADAAHESGAAPQATRAANEYEVGSPQDLTDAIAEIERSGATEATIVLTADVDGNVQFAGIAGVHVTVRSEGDAVHLLDMKSTTSLLGGLTLDNVQVTANTIYACGHDFETTDSFADSFQNFYGGGPEGVDVTGDPTITIRGGSFQNFYGGGKDSDLDGSVHIIVDDPATREGVSSLSGINSTIGNFHGGGHAEDTPSGKVTGNVTVDFRSGWDSTFFGGGQNYYSDTDGEGDREPASVGGTVTVNFGYEGAPSGCVWPGTAMLAVHGGSEHSTVGDIRLYVNDGTNNTGGSGDTDFFGCGIEDTVRGTVEMHITGGDFGEWYSTFFGGGDEESRLPIRVLNADREETAVSIVYDNPRELDGTSPMRRVIAGSQGNVETVYKGDVKIEIRAAALDAAALDNEDPGLFSSYDSSLTINGSSHISVASGHVFRIQGHYAEYESEETDELTTASITGGSEGSPVEIGYFNRLDQVTIGSGANALVDSYGLFDVEEPGRIVQKPFYNTDELNVDAGATLTTRGNGQARLLSGVYLAGTWNQEYASGTTMAGDSDRSAADLRIGNWLEVDGGTLVSHGTAHVYNDVECTGGTLVLMGQTIFSMTDSNNREVSFDGTELHLPIVPSAGEGYPEATGEPIRLACGDALSGTVNVHLFEDPAAWSTDAVIADGHVGTNYIDASTERSDLKATLANANAEEDGYFFRRVADADKTDAAGEDYDMWQIDAYDVMLDPLDMIAYTGGASQGGDSFPATRYRVWLAPDIDAADVEIVVDGTAHALPDGTASGDVVALPWLPDVFTLSDGSQMGGAEDSEGEVATNDLAAGEYAVSVDASKVDVTAAGKPADYRFGTSILTVRDVSEPEGVVSGDVDVAQPVVTDASQVDTSDGIGIAVIAEGTRFFTNGREELGLLGAAEDGDAQISLLFDELLPGEKGEDTAAVLRERAATDGHALTGENSEFRYLDLVNENDGNAWVSTEDGARIEIWWPVPEGVDPEAVEFSVLHFQGLHREYRDDLADQIAACEIEVIDARIEGDNVVFTLTGDQDEGCFSPFALTWTARGDRPVQPGQPGDTPGTSAGKTEGLVATGDAVPAVIGAVAVAGTTLVVGGMAARRRDG